MWCIAMVQIELAFDLNLNLFHLNQIAKATGPIFKSTQTRLKVAYLDREFYADHFSYIICPIWSSYELFMNFQIFFHFLDFFYFFYFFYFFFFFLELDLWRHGDVTGGADMWAMHVSGLVF